MTKKEERKLVLEKCNGRCAYCGEELTNKFHVDHLIPVKRISKWENGKFKPTGKMENPEMDIFENKYPACASCNISKSSLSLENFRNVVEDRLNQLERLSIYKMAKRFKMIIEKPQSIKFYFETL